MLDKKTVKKILLEVEASYHNYEKYLQEVIDIVLNDNNGDIKYIIAREKNYNYLHLYKYSASNYIAWLYNNFYIDDADVNNLIVNYEIILEYVRNYSNDEYLTSGYDLNKKLYKELIKIKRGLK